MTDDEIRRILLTQDRAFNWGMLAAVLTAGTFFGVLAYRLFH